jgi:hypothetical protein
MDIRGRFTTGTTAASEAQVELPDSLTIGNTGSVRQRVGSWTRDLASSVNMGPTFITEGDTYLNFGRNDGGTANPYDTATGANIGGITTIFTFFAYGIPIAEWANSQAYMGNTNPTTIAARYTTNAGQSIDHNSYEIVNFEDKSYDESPSNSDSVTTGASWKFTAERKGKYQVNSSVLFDTVSYTTTQVVLLAIYKTPAGGSASVYSRSSYTHPYTGATNLKSVSISDTVDLDAGDSIDIRAYQNTGSGLTIYNSQGDYNYVSITELTAAPHAAMFNNATSTRAGLVSAEESGSVSLASSGDFTAGTLFYSRLGKQVTLTTDTDITFASNAAPASAAAVLPSSIRPGATTYNVCYADGSAVWIFKAQADGTIAVTFRDWAGSTSARTTIPVGVSITYTLE